jgi:repressor LexA
MPNTLTRRQTEILAFLREAAVDGEPPPSLDDVCRALGLSSRGSLHKHVQALVDAGYLEPIAGKRRGLRLTAAAQPQPDGLPLLGRIAAGRPLEVPQRAEPVAVPAWLQGSANSYVLEVHGDSMQDDGILDGDHVVIDPDAPVKDGRIVVALIDGAEVTLKRLERGAASVTLHPASATSETMTLAPERVVIQGVVVGQMRRY